MFARRIGFTLIELMIVIAIIICLAGIAAPMFARNTLNAKISKAKSELDTIRTAADLYRHDTKQWVPLGNTGDGLINNNAGVANWNGPYMYQWKDDPWGVPYEIYDDGVAPVQRLARSNSLDPADPSDDITIVLCPDTSIP